MSVSIAAPLRWRDLRRSVKICVVAFVALLVAGVLEVGSRIYWRAVKDVATVRHDAIFRTFYPEMDEAHIDAVAPYHGDDTYEVLLLGGSVLHQLFGDLSQRLRTGLEQKLGRKVHVANLANLGLTSRDSLNKYAHLSDKRFDLVIAYEGINDVKLNNTPPGAYRADYSHHTRFAQIKTLRKHKELPYLAFPYTTYYLTSSLLDRLHLTNRPRPELVQHGDAIRTPPAFEANMEALTRLAHQRGDRLVLLTCAATSPRTTPRRHFRRKRSITRATPCRC